VWRAAALPREAATRVVRLALAASSTGKHHGSSALLPGPRSGSAQQAPMQPALRRRRANRRLFRMRMAEMMRQAFPSAHSRRLPVRPLPWKAPPRAAWLLQPAAVA
jgi:hypothetical protein